MAINYGWEKFFASMQYAVGSSTPLPERLATVMYGIHHLSRDNFPDDDSWSEFEGLLTATTSHFATADEGRIAATTQRMNDDEAKKLLETAMGIFSDIAQAYGRER